MVERGPRRDFSQEVQLRLVEALREGRIAHDDHIGGFVLGICRNLAREGARRDERRRALWERHGPVLEAVRAYERPTLRVARLEDCLSQLTGRAREVLHRSFCLDESAGEIASNLGILETNVRVIRHRSLRALRLCLDIAQASYEVVP